MPKVKKVKVKGQVARPGVPLEFRVKDLERNIGPLYGAVHNPLTQETALGFVLREIKARGLANEEAICPRVAARQTALEKNAVRQALEAVKFEERLSALERNAPPAGDGQWRAEVGRRIQDLEKQEEATAAHVVKLLLNARLGKERLMADLKQDVRKNADAEWANVGRVFDEVVSMPRIVQKELLNRLLAMYHNAGRG